MLDSVEANLLPRRNAWDDVTDPIDPAVVTVMLEWAWTHPDLLAAIREAYRLEDEVATDTRRQPFFELVSLWLSGRPFADMGAAAGLDMDDLLGIHSRAVTFVLQTLIEQAVALLERLLLSQGRVLSAAVVQFPEHLRFGAPTPAARILATRGLRHRRAAVELGNALTGRALSEDRAVLFPIVREIIEDNREDWRNRLGRLVFERTLQDLL